MARPNLAICLTAALLAAPIVLLLPASALADGPFAYTLYGDAADGWGNSTANVTNPGPTLVVERGRSVILTLIGNDSADHNWFLDYDDDGIDDPDEPNSTEFRASTVTFEFVPDRAGSFTYRCRVHPNSMTGRIEVRTAPRTWDVTLLGDTRDGWGPSLGNITNPGPRLSIDLGDSLNLTLIGNDSADHNWFLDYDDDGIDGPDEPNSTLFRGTTVRFLVTPDRAGTYTYRCRVHPTTMTGIIEIRAADGGVPPRDGIVIPLIPGIMYLTIAFTLLFAAGYHLRAVRNAREKG